MKANLRSSVLRHVSLLLCVALISFGGAAAVAAAPIKGKVVNTSLSGQLLKERNLGDQIAGGRQADAPSEGERLVDPATAIATLVAVGKKCFPGGVSVEFKKFMSEKGGTGKVRIDKVKEYWEGKYKGNNKLTRGVVKAFGGKVAAVAKLFKYAVEFGVEGCGGKFVTTIWKAVKGILGGEKPTSQGYIDYVKSVFSEDIGKVNPEAKDAPALTSDQEKGLDKV